jgi:hypothetical protein
MLQELKSSPFFLLNSKKLKISWKTTETKLIVPDREPIKKFEAPKAKAKIVIKGLINPSPKDLKNSYL